MGRGILSYALNTKVNSSLKTLPTKGFLTKDKKHIKSECLFNIRYTLHTMFKTFAWIIRFHPQTCILNSVSLYCYSYFYSQFFFYWHLCNRGVKSKGGFSEENFRLENRKGPKALALDSGTGLSQFLLQPWGKSSVNVSSARKIYFCSAVWSCWISCWFQELWMSVVFPK